MNKKNTTLLRASKLILMGLFISVCYADVKKRNTDDFVRFGYSLYINYQTKKPIKSSVEKIANVHTKDQLDELEKRFYPGLTIYILHIKSSEPYDLFSHAEISDKTIIIPCGVKIGDTKEKTIQKLGPPTINQSSDIIAYDTDDGTIQAWLYFKNARLLKIVWVDAG